MTSMFGQPMLLGSGSTAIWVWRMPSPQPVVTTAPAVAMVDSGTWATAASIPALKALGIPAAYRQSFDNNQYPVSPKTLPDSVMVMPRLNNTCRSDAAGSAAVMVETTASSVQLTIGRSLQDLPLLTTSPRLPGWGVYGPFSIAAGANSVTAGAASSAALTLGPCLGWSQLTAAALGVHKSSVNSITLTSSGEQITAATGGANGTWVELLRYYDPGWRLDTHKPISLGNGLFNLYHLDAAQTSHTTLAFAFSTLPWEHIGQGVAVVAVLVAIWLIVRVPRRLRETAVVPSLATVGASFPPSRLARWIGGVGLAMLAVTAVGVTLEWFGIPSAIPEATVAPDPYSVDVGYGGVAIALLLLSLAVRFIAGIRGASREDVVPAHGEEPARARVPTGRLPVGAAMVSLVMAAVLASCGESASDFQNLITQAQQAGSVAPSIIGSSLSDARLQRAAKQPDLCIADYTQALQQFPTLVSAFVGRGDCYLNGGQNGAAAVHDYTEAIVLSPLSADLYLRRAVAYRVIGNLAASAADYKQAALNPAANAGQQLIAIDELVSIADFTDAQTAYARAITLDPQSSLLFVAGGDLAIARGDPNLADQDYTKAWQLASQRSEFAQVLAHQCQAEVFRHEYFKATTDCAEAANLSTSGSGAYDDLAQANLALGNLSAALADINSAISNFIGNAGPYTQPDGVDGFGLANLYAARGWIEIQLGQTPSAVTDFQTALSSLPGAAPDTRARIKAYIETAKKDE